MLYRKTAEQSYNSLGRHQNHIPVFDAKLFQMLLSEPQLLKCTKRKGIVYEKTVKEYLLALLFLLIVWSVPSLGATEVYQGYEYSFWFPTYTQGYNISSQVKYNRIEENIISDYFDQAIIKHEMSSQAYATNFLITAFDGTQITNNVVLSGSNIPVYGRLTYLSAYHEGLVNLRVNTGSNNCYYTIGGHWNCNWNSNLSNGSFSW